MSDTTGAWSEPQESSGPAQGRIDRIRTAFDIVRFRASAVDHALADEGGFPFALAIVALAGVALGVGRSASLGGVILMAIAQVLTSLLMAGILHLGARLVLDGEQDFVRFYRTFGLTYLVFWAAGIPIVHALFRWALWAWQLAAAVLVIERAYRLERVRAALLVIVVVVIAALVAIVFNGLVLMASLITGRLF